MAETETLAREDEPEPVSYDSPFRLGYLGFVAANGFSAIGNSAWFVALTVLLTELASPTVVGAVLALSSLPSLAGMLIGGAVVDKVGPRKVMIVSDALRCAVQGAAAAVAYLADLSVAVLALVLLLTNLANAFFMPAAGALRPRLLPGEHLLRGNSLYSLGTRGGQALGGPVGALLIGLGGTALVAAFDAASFALSALAVFLVRVPALVRAAPAPAAGAPAQDGLGSRIREGLRYIRGHRDLLWLIVLIGLSELASMGPVNVGLVLLADQYGHPLGVGALLTAFTLGAVVSFLATVVWPTKRRSGGVVVYGVAAQAALLVVLGQLGSIVPAVAVYFGLGVLSGLVGNVLSSLVQLWSKAEVRGRVMSVLSMTVFIAAPLGNLMLGWFVQLMGLAATMALHGALAAAAAAIALVRPAIGRARLD